MPANNNPIFTLSPDIQWPAATLTAANTAKDGTGTVSVIFTAGSNGAYITRLVARPLGTNVQSVLRVFINNGASNATPANNVLRHEMTLPATTLSEVAAQPDYVLPLNIALKAGQAILCTLGTAVAAGYAISIDGGQY
jgi:hypothetical protein